MRRTGNQSLLMLLTSAIAACGGNVGTALQSGDASNDALQAETSTADNAGPTPEGSAGDSAMVEDAPGAQTDAAGDASGIPTDALAEAAGDAGCPPGTTPLPDGGCLPQLPRPFRVGSSLRKARPSEGGDWLWTLPALASELDASTAERLAQAWLQSGLEEHASIAAFARFTMHLLAIGAPPDLVARSQRASLDEIRHARCCFALAQRYSHGRARGPALLAVHDVMGDTSFEAIVALAAEEGCVGETLGAALAAEQLSVASDAGVVAVLRGIAADEARHAELAWRFLTWAIARGGPRVAQIATKSIERAIASTFMAEPRSEHGFNLEIWHAHGRLTGAEIHAYAERAVREVVRPCLQAVLAAQSATGADHLMHTA